MPDEQLQSILVLRIRDPDGNEEPEKPPASLIDLLAHIQVSFEASYISPVAAAPETPRTSRLLGTPRTGALPRPSGRLNPHPSILPPSTPNPTPATGDHDRKYIASEGTVLVAQIWGANTAEDSLESFALLWSDEEESWIAVYRMALTVCTCLVHSIDQVLPLASFPQIKLYRPTSVSDGLCDSSREANLHLSQTSTCPLLLLNR